MAVQKVLIAVTNLLGVGHFARMAALGRALAAAGYHVTLVSGGRPNPTIGIDDLVLVQMPPVHCRNGDFAKLLDDTGAIASSDLLEARAHVMAEAFAMAEPDIVITELYPFGRRALAREFEALLALVASRVPRPLLLCSIRDVLNPPTKAGRAWSVLARLAAYDGILVHGDYTLPLDRSWPVTPDLERQLHYAGYLRDDARAAVAPATDDARAGILVSGGGSDAGLALAEAAVAAASLIPDEPWHILVSLAVPPDRLAAMRAMAPAHALVEPARGDFPSLLARARISVSQAGYNTVLDLAAAGPRAVLVPFAAGQEREQTLRAEAISTMGLARLLPESELAGETLAAVIRAVADDPAPDWTRIRLDGATRATAIIRTLAEGHAAATAAWAELDALLAAMSAEGDRVGLWLRDDDVVAVTPALERFLAQLARFDIPAGFAAIPANLEAGLADRLARGDGIWLLVHGFRHTNHAPPAERAAEFGAHRRREVMRAELVDGLARLRDTFGAQALPVFVPPWNRIDEAVARSLAELGYSGLSTFAGRREAGDSHGFTQMNCHWDPIDWKGKRGLKPAATLLRELCALIAAQRAQPMSIRQPIGLLTHHLVHDGWMDRFLDALFEKLAGARAIQFLSPDTVFSRAEGRRS
jgi:predicted glycosyltransferase